VTLHEVQTAVDWIFTERGDDTKCGGDAEAMHFREDTLYRSILEEVASGNPDAPAMARLALTTQELGFSRWCA